MPQYADYAYYIGEYAGTLVSSDEFTQLVTRASAQVDSVTFGRAATVVSDDTDADAVSAIKNATCAVVDTLHEAAEGGESGVTSESVGGHSVSYAEKAPATRSLAERVRVAAALYLAPTYLMFPGFDEGEYSSDRTGRRPHP